MSDELRWVAWDQHGEEPVVGQAVDLAGGGGRIVEVVAIERFAWGMGKWRVTAVYE